MPLAQPTDVAVIILAAGAGTRMKSALPKMLHEVAGRSMLGHALYAAAALNPAQIITVIGHGREQVSPAVTSLGDELGLTAADSLKIAIQEEQKGTGHAVAVAMEQLAADFSGTVIVTTSDVPLLNGETLAALQTEHHRDGGAQVTVLTTTVPDPTGYGRIIRNAAGEVTEIVEQKDATAAQRQITEINSGVYAFAAPVLRKSLSQLNNNNAQGEYYLTDVIALARENQGVVRGHLLADAELVAGVNDRVQLAAANKAFNRRLVTAAMLGGATIIDPESTWLDVTVTIGQDVTILPGCQLKGHTTIADGATIGPDTTLIDMQIGANAQVVRTHGLSSTIGPNANVGPFTYIRPGTVLGERGKLGGFVEAKNAQIGAGSKVPHLTYIGDATVGEESNIGASSVFVNYDGVNKHHTTIGSHVRTGSDTMFIAPVTVGDGAYSGAGTVIREDVPPGALVVSGGPQRNIEGWVERKRPGTPAALAAQRAKNPTPEQQTNQEG